MLRHYLEGSAFMLASLFLFVTALRRESLRMACAAAVPYLLAMTAKEIYVPLAVVALFLPEKDFRTRLKFSAPLLSMLPLYFAWRYWMLGRPLGGYQDAFFNSAIASEGRRIMVTNVAESIRMVSGQSSISPFLHPLSIAFAALVLAGALYASWRLKRFSLPPFVAVVLFSMYAPVSFAFIYFHTGDFGTYRFVYAVSMAYASAAALFGSVLNSLLGSSPDTRPFVKTALRWTGSFLCILMLMLVLWSTAQWITTIRTSIIRPLVSEASFLMSHPGSDFMEKSFVYPFDQYYLSLAHFRQTKGAGSMPEIFFKTFAYIDRPGTDVLQGRRVYKYNAARNEMEEITQDFLERRARFIDRIRHLPLEVHLMLRAGKFNFSLGPSETGRYFVLVGHRPGLSFFSLDVPRTLPSNIVWGNVTWYLRFGWESPEGFVTLSPEWRFDFTKDQEILWRR
jgi:hypothetical protein